MDLGKQCADLTTVSDEWYARIQGILGMPKRRRNFYALTTSEVLDFTRWLPYRTREEFAQYRADHPELEPFSSYDFDAPNLAHNKEAEDEGGSSQGCSFCMVGLGFPWQFLTLLVLLQE